MSDKKVIIVGAGCAGLSAAYTLKKQGIDPIVYEAGDVPGGRCRSEVVDGHEFGVGPAMTEPQWHTTFRYLDELNLRNLIVGEDEQLDMRLTFLIDGKLHPITLPKSIGQALRNIPEDVRFIRNALPPKAYWHVVKAFAALRPYMKQVDAKNHDFSALAEISHMSTKDFMYKHGAPLANEWFFSPYMNMMVLGNPDQISVAHPVALFSLMKGFVSLRGGLGVITQALYDQVKDCVRLNTPVSEIVIENGAVTGVMTPDGFVEADQVLCCVDAPAALELMPGLPRAMRQPLETCEYSQSFYYQFVIDGFVSAPPGTVVLHPETDSSLFIDLTVGPDEQPGKSRVGMFTKGSRHAELASMSDEVREHTLIREIQKVFPEMPDRPVLTWYHRWDRAINTEPPGQFTAIHDLVANHMDDVQGLYLAGEYLFLIACTEGALNTGRLAGEKAGHDRKLLEAVAAKREAKTTAAA